MDINGLIYLLNQAGAALAEANSRIEALSAENTKLIGLLGNDIDSNSAQMSN